MTAMLLIATLTMITLELILVHKLKLMPWFVKYQILDAAFSMALSIVIGAAFGISGLILVTATILSSIVTWFVYTGTRGYHKILAIKGKPNWLSKKQIEDLISEISKKPGNWALVGSVKKEDGITNLQSLLENNGSAGMDNGEI